MIQERFRQLRATFGTRGAALRALAITPMIATVLVTCASTRASGDGGEYLLTSVAFVRHQSPEIRSADALWVEAREPELRHMVRAIRQGIDKQEIAPLGAVRRTPEGRYYTIHFWFYSLLAAPFVWLADLLGVRPVFGLGTVNALAALGACAYLGRLFTKPWVLFAARLLFVLCGTTFYLGWTGPEVLTASAVLVASLAATRGELALACAAIGLGATQNPTAAALFPFVLAWWLLLRFRPRFGFGGEPPDRGFRARDALLGVTGVALAVLPYAFFHQAFGIPSLIGKYATDPKLIGPERLASFFTDLNQGVIVGVPGLLLATSLATAIALVRAESRDRLTLALSLTLTDLILPFLIVPTLATHNWNSGCSVFMRYAYWTSMPVLAVLLYLLPRLSSLSRDVAIAIAAALQLGILAINGISGERSSYLRHSWAAAIALRHYPAAYDPIPEIFVERTLEREVPVPDALVMWPRRKGKPTKILASDSAQLVTKRLCAGRAPFAATSSTPLPGHFTYYNGPFSCGSAAASSSGSAEPRTSP